MKKLLIITLFLSSWAIRAEAVTYESTLSSEKKSERLEKIEKQKSEKAQNHAEYEILMKRYDEHAAQIEEQRARIALEIRRRGNR